MPVAKLKWEGRSIWKIYFMSDDYFPLKVCRGRADRKSKEWSPFTAEPAGNAGRTETKDGKVIIP
jgi:hypothetical protein